MPIMEDELQREKSYLLKVREVIEKIIKEDSAGINYSTSNINELKRFMWENLSDYTDEERAIALYDVDRSVDITNSKIDRVRKYVRASSTPYFGKVLFKDEFEELPIYIGITTVQDGLQFYVFDWRAPVSSLFYNYELGKASYLTPAGNVSGEILEKMQFKIVDGKMLRCFKCDVNIDDEYLQEILASSSSDKMKNIVSTIQREQNEIIRNNSEKFLIVQGIAGSGKTSVALHRIAYLLYQDVNLKSNNILILSPSDVFSDYISDVLPELGEENVMRSTFSEFASTYLKDYHDVESYPKFLERSYGGDKSDLEIVNYKMSDQYERDLISFLKEYEEKINFSEGIQVQNNSLSSQELRDLFLGRFKKFPLVERIYVMADHVCLKFGLSKSRYFNAVRKQLYESSGIELDFVNLYKKFLLSKGLNNYDFNNGIKYEDIAGLLYTFFEVNGYPNCNNIKHIVIDEVQDYTHFQMRILKRIFNRSSFTVLGDINQGINPYYHYETLNQLADIFPNSRYIELNKAYRSSQEIVEYTNRILHLDNACSVRSSMDVPVEIKCVPKKDLADNIKNDVASMQESQFNKIAIITHDSKQAVEIQKLVGNDIDAQLVASSETFIKKPIVIIPSYLSKGLEFDAVIAYSDSNEQYGANEENLFYVVCTRAQHKLNVYNEPSKLLKK